MPKKRASQRKGKDQHWNRLLGPPSHLSQAEMGENGPSQGRLSLLNLGDIPLIPQLYPTKLHPFQIGFSFLSSIFGSGWINECFLNTLKLEITIHSKEFIILAWKMDPDIMSLSHIHGEKQLPSKTARSVLYLLVCKPSQQLNNTNIFKNRYWSRFWIPIPMMLF